MTKPVSGLTPKKNPIRLKKWARWIAGLVGAASLSAGAVAAFTRSLEAPPVGLMAIGTIFLLIGLAGVMPTRLKIGDNEAEWQAVVEGYRELVDEVVDDSPPARQQLIVERLASVDPPAAYSAMTGLTYERTILGMLKEIVEGRGDHFASIPAFTNDSTILDYDALITRADGKRRTLVEIKRTRPSMTAEWVDDLHRRLIAPINYQLGIQMLLLIVDQPLPLATQKRLNAFAQIRYIVCGGRHDIQLLHIAVESVIGQTLTERATEKPGDGDY
jgi:hypothetical protein